MVKESKSASNGGLSVAKRIPCEPDSRLEIPVCGILVHCPDGTTGVGEYPAVWRCICGVIEYGGLARGFFLHRDHLLAQAKVQGEILPKGAIIPQVKSKKNLTVTLAVEGAFHT